MKSSVYLKAAELIDSGDAWNIGDAFRLADKRLNGTPAEFFGLFKSGYEWTKDTRVIMLLFLHWISEDKCQTRP